MVPNIKMRTSDIPVTVDIVRVEEITEEEEREIIGSTELLMLPICIT